MLSGGTGPLPDGTRGGRSTSSREAPRTAPGKAARRAARLAADGPACVWCGRTLEEGLVRATTEHVVPRVKGGPSWAENELVACARCNRARGHRTPAEWADECERRGWPVDRERIRLALEELAAAIGERGGMRRARRYVESQRRRFR